MFSLTRFGFAARVMTLFALVSLAYAQIDPCDLNPGDCRTQTRGGWSQTCNFSRVGGNVGCTRDSFFTDVFPGGLTIGGGFTIHFDSSGAVRDFLSFDAAGPSGVLDNNYVNPNSPPWPPVGTFGAQVTALAMNIGFGDSGVAGFTDIRGFYIWGGPFNGWIIDSLFALANRVLGGNLGALPTGKSLSDLNGALTTANEGCVGGNDFTGYLCPEPPCPVQPPVLIELYHSFCLDFCGRPITVYWCCPFDGPPVFSRISGPLWTEVHPFVRDSINSACPAPGGWWSAVFTAEDTGLVCVNFDEQLAVELLDFSATAGDQSVTLRWSTASESDNDYFEILRDGVRVHRRSSVGSSTSRTDYAWTDETALTAGTTYEYALSAVDIGGNRLQLGTRSVTLSEAGAVAGEFALEQNYPNPFNPVTTIAFSLAEKSLVSLAVYDLTGREVASLLNEEKDSGRHAVTFDAATLPTGVYFYHLRAGSFSEVRKLILMK